MGSRGARGSVMVEALCYKPEGLGSRARQMRWADSDWDKKLTTHLQLVPRSRKCESS
jgi:hypothetical protein